jgi:serine/threonine protein kinase
VLDVISEERLKDFFYVHDVEKGEGIIGEGSYSVVQEATWHSIPCAVKKFTIDHRNEEEIKHFEREARTWAAFLRHPNVVQIYGLWEGQGPQRFPSIVMELMADSLPQFLQNHIKMRDVIALDLKRAILLDVCGAMVYLHSLGIIYRDLKGSNILLASSLVAKICDLGTARMYDTINDLQGEPTKGHGDPSYADPRSKEKGYGLEIDVYSFGNVIILILTHKKPEPRGKITCSEFAKREYLLADLSNEIKDEFLPLIEECLDSEVEQRPEFIDIYKTLSNKPYLKDCDRYSIMKGELDNLYTEGSMKPVTLGVNYETCDDTRTDIGCKKTDLEEPEFTDDKEQPKDRMGATAAFIPAVPQTQNSKDKSLLEPQAYEDQLPSTSPEVEYGTPAPPMNEVTSPSPPALPGDQDDQTSFIQKYRLYLCVLAVFFSYFMGIILL